MARVKIENGQLVISVKGARKFFAMKSEVAVPIANVESVQTGLNWQELPKVFDKIIGTNSNHLYYGGTFREGGIFSDGDKVFYDLRRKEEAVVITLKDEEFKRLVIGVDNPDEVVALIQQALA